MAVGGRERWRLSVCHEGPRRRQQAAFARTLLNRRLLTRLRELVRELPKRYCFLVLLLTIDIASNLIWVGLERHGLQDLGSFLHSGAAYREHINPYSYHPWLDPQPISESALNLNPPISVYFFAALASFDPGFVELLFFVGSTALLAVALIALVHEYPDKRNLVTVLAVLSLAGVWHMLWYLQLYAPLALAVVGAWLLSRRGNLIWSAALLGLVVAFKPNYGLLLLLLFAAGHRRVAVTACLSASFVSAIPLLIDGPAIYRQWLDYAAAFDGIEWASNASVMSVGARFGLPYAGETVALLLVLAVLYRQWRMRPPLLDSIAISLIAAIAFGPVSWAGYTLFLLPFLFSIRWDRLTWTAILLLGVPFFVVRGAAREGDAADLLVGCVYAFAVLLLLARAFLEGAGAERAAARPDRSAVSIRVNGAPLRRPNAGPVPPRVDASKMAAPDGAPSYPRLLSDSS